MKVKTLPVIFFLLTLLTPLSAFEHSAWFGKDKELLSIFNYTFQHARTIASKPTDLSIDATNHLIFLAFALSPNPTWNMQFQAQGAYTQESNFFFNALQATVEKNWFNDLLGDPLSLTTNFTLLVPTKESLHNPSTPHTAQLQCEGGFTIGKERTEGAHWTWRYWGNLQLGVGTKGSPWLTGKVAVEKQLSPKNHWRLCAKYNKGFGNHPLTTLNGFKGYGTYAYRSLDLGGRYIHLFPGYGNLGIQLEYRPYARFFPKNQTRFSISFSLPISLSTSFHPWKPSSH